MTAAAVETIHAVPAATANETQGALILQPEPCARLSRILFRASTDLQDVCCLHDHGQMYEEARAIASRILAACPLS